jgi:hypothetical protein
LEPDVPFVYRHRFAELAARMAIDQRYDVHRTVGLWFIGGCLVVGFLCGSIVPYAADQVGLIHLASSKGILLHVQPTQALALGCLAALLGTINGVALAIQKRYWFLGFLIAFVPCGVIGGLAASATPHPFFPLVTASAFLAIPILTTGGCVFLRNEVWRRHQKPVIVRS